MAAITPNQDGSLRVDLTPDEQDAYAGLPPGQLEEYVTLWLAERGKDVLLVRFNKLSGKDKGDVLAILNKP